MSEKQIQDSILHYLKKSFPSSVVWKLHEDPVFGVIGIPDIFFAYNGKAFFFEVKDSGKGASKIQEVVLNKLVKNGIIAEVVYSVLQVKLILLQEELDVCL